MKRENDDTQYWCRIDQELSLTGQLPQDKDADHAAYLSQFELYDQRKGEALHLTEDLNPLIAVRTLLLRGRFEEARKIISENSRSDSPFFHSEMLMEEARLAMFEGRWRDCEALIDATLSLDPVPVSRLALLQMKTLILLEQLRWTEAMTSCQQAQSLAELFPHCISTMYLKTLEIKLIARLHSPAQARTQLVEYYRSMIELGRFDLDFASVYVRVETDLRRHLFEDFRRCALASYAIEEHMGEELYASLALLELSYCHDSRLQSQARTLLKASTEKFKRISRFVCEIIGTSTLSDTSQTIAKNYQKPTIRAAETQGLQKYQNFLFVPLATAIGTGTPAVDLAGHARIFAALRSLADGPLSKEDFFAAVWGSQKYAPHLHDGSIRNLLCRTRKLTQIPVRLKSGKVEAEGLLVVT